jgi:large subunit ribosomal protein L25
MARQIADLLAEVRTGTGKGAARQARREGNVPGIVYGDGQEPVALNLNYNYLVKHLKAGRFLQTLFNLKVAGLPDVHVICRAVQRDVVKDIPTHVDFMRLHDESRIVLHIHVTFINHE